MIELSTFDEIESTSAALPPDPEESSFDYIDDEVVVEYESLVYIVPDQEFQQAMLNQVNTINIRLSVILVIVFFSVSIRLLSITHKEGH